MEPSSQGRIRGHLYHAPLSCKPLFDLRTWSGFPYLFDSSRCTTEVSSTHSTGMEHSHSHQHHHDESHSPLGILRQRTFGTSDGYSHLWSGMGWHWAWQFLAPEPAIPNHFRRSTTLRPTQSWGTISTFPMCERLPCRLSSAPKEKGKEYSDPLTEAGVCVEHL